MRPTRSSVAVGIFLLVGLFGAEPVSGQGFQRMGLFLGSSVRVGPGGSGELPARCTDEHAAPPVTSDRFTQVLNAPSDAVTVTVGDRTVTLEDAIKKGLVSVRGVAQAPCFNCRIDAVRIVNHTQQPILVQVNKPAVLGGSSHQPFDYDVGQLLSSRASQRTIWAQQEELAKRQVEVNKRYQQDLADLGYYRGPFDGSLGSRTVQATRRFEVSRGLGSAAGTAIGASTKTAAQEAAANVRRLRELNSSDSEIVVVTLAYEAGNPRRPLYVVQGVDGEVGYAGDQVGKLTGTLKTVLTRSKAHTLFVDMKDFPPGKADALASALRTAQRRNSETIMRIVARDADGKTGTQDALFRRGVVIERTTDVTFRNGRYQAEAVVRHGKLRITVRAMTAKAGEIVQRFMNRLRDLIGLAPGRISLAEAVSRARREIKTLYKLSDDDLTIELQNEFGDINIVRRHLSVTRNVGP
jgi:peptidoglycan hydrolase-like protein with peptidoglycan-binding domain